MPLPALSPPVHTRPGATSDAFLRAAQAMIKDRQVTHSRVKKLVAIANSDFQLGPHAAGERRAPASELLQQINALRQEVSTLGSSTAARVLTLELTQLEQQANTPCRQPGPEVKRASCSSDGTLSTPAPSDGFNQDSLAGWLATALDKGIRPDALTAFAQARFGYARAIDSFSTTHVELERHRSPGFVDLSTVQRELDAAHGVLARYAGAITRADIRALDRALEQIEKEVKTATRFCHLVLKDPTSARIEGRHTLARSWLGQPLPASGDAALQFAPAQRRVAAATLAPDLQAAMQQTKPLIELLLPHVGSPQVPTGLIDAMVTNARLRYQYEHAIGGSSNAMLDVMMRRSAGCLSLEAAKLEVEVTWDATEHMQDASARAGIRRSLAGISGALEKGERFWHLVKNDKVSALIPGLRELAQSWLGEAPAPEKRSHSDLALPAAKTETTVKLLSCPVAASDHARRVLPHAPEHEPSIHRPDRELQHLSEPLRAFVNAMFEETSQ